MGFSKQKYGQVVIGTVVALCMLGVSVFAGYLLLQDKGQTADADKIVAKAGKHYQLPAGETPVVAEIKDISKLPEQTRASLSGAENGDYLLLYQQSGLAVVYRQQGDMVVLARPVAVDQANGVAGEQTQQSSPVVPVQPSINRY